MVWSRDAPSASDSLVRAYQTLSTLKSTLWSGGSSARWRLIQESRTFFKRAHLINMLNRVRRLRDLQFKLSRSPDPRKIKIEVLEDSLGSTHI